MIINGLSWLNPIKQWLCLMVMNGFIIAYWLLRVYHGFI